jgi:hypothetical protein
VGKGRVILALREGVNDASSPCKGWLSMKFLEDNINFF